MFNSLTINEKEMMYLFIYGQSCGAIMELLNLDYIDYKRTKRSLLKKLKLKRIIELLPYAIENDIDIN